MNNRLYNSEKLFITTDMRSFLPLIVVLALLSGCTGQVQKLRALAPAGDDYASVLAAEYLAFSESEAERGHYLAAEHYAQKGLKSLKGEAVAPDEPDSPASERADARAQLYALATLKMQKAAGKKLARAQVLFDCWNDEISLWPGQEKTPCAAEFQASLADLRDTAEAILYNDQKTYTLSFASGSARVSAAAQSKIKAVARGLRGKTHYAVDMYAHILAGKGVAALTQQRLDNVKTALLAAGIPAEHIHAVSEDDSSKVFLGSDVRPQASNRMTVIVKTHSRSKE